jgi:hypothetical protein
MTNTNFITCKAKCFERIFSAYSCFSRCISGLSVSFSTATLQFYCIYKNFITWRESWSKLLFGRVKSKTLTRKPKFLKRHIWICWKKSQNGEKTIISAKLFDTLIDKNISPLGSLVSLHKSSRMAAKVATTKNLYKLEPVIYINFSRSLFFMCN